MPMDDDILTLTVLNFDEKAVHSPLPILIEFRSEKYPSCSRLTAIVDELAENYRGEVRFGCIDVDEQPKLASLLSIGGLPCVLAMQNGRIFANIGGILPKSYYERLLDRMIAEASGKNFRKK